jgi:hypothetical protein
MRLLNLKSIVLVTIFLAPFNKIFAADLIRIQPLTDKILVLHFDEGHIDYFGKNENRFNGNRIYYSPLDLVSAQKPENYQVSSPDDDHFRDPKLPIAIGRKAKGVDFNNIYDAGEPAAIKHHWIYLELPHSLQRGKTYTVALNDFAANVNQFTFIYEEKKLRSPAIHVNQIGFVPAAPKYAYLSHFMGSFDTETHPNGALNLDAFAQSVFHLVRQEDDSVVFSGKITKQRDKNDADFNRTDIDFTHPNMTRADVWECDFSAFRIPGEYRIVVERMGCSYPFEIKEDVYRDPYYFTSRAMFTQRQGIIQEIEPGLNYPRDFREEDGTKIRYFPELKDEEAFDPAGGVGEVKGIWGWYHDAGDWDGYASHYSVPMGLLALFDLKPENFGDGDVHAKYKLAENEAWINEGENGLPDVLDEARWLIQFYQRTKNALIAQGYSTGGVPGYVGVDAGAIDGRPSWEDTRVLALKGADSVLVTYRYAACAAYLAVCLNKFQQGLHPESENWISEAETAYAWAQQQNQASEGDVNRARMEAAAALYRYTAKIGYQNDFRSCKKNDTQWKSRLWFNLQPWHFAATILGMIPAAQPGLDRTLQQQCIADIVSQANLETVQTAKTRGFRYGLDQDILFVLGTFSTPHIFLAAAAYQFTGEQKFLDACYTTADYCLGGNQMDLVKVSGLGENYERQPFHPDSWYLMDFNSRVYTNPILPGYVAYEMYRTGDWQNGASWSWVGDEDFSRSTAFPEIANFPDAEARFSNRNSIAGSEFTIHQNQILALFAYGFLCGPHTEPYIPNTRPELSLTLEDNISVKMDSVLTLRVTASPDMRRVEYFYNWHFIGESTDKANDFAFPWDLSKYKIPKGRHLITAKGYDDKGLETWPSAAGAKTISVLISTSIQHGAAPHFGFGLEPCYPNPANPSTAIVFSLPATDFTKVDIFNTLGQKMATLVEGRLAAGSHTVNLDLSGFASGTYFCCLEQNQARDVKKFVVLK